MGRGLGRINFVNTCPGKTWLCPGKTWLCQNMAENFQTYFTIYLLVPEYKIMKIEILVLSLNNGLTIIFLNPGYFLRKSSLFPSKI